MEKTGVNDGGGRDGRRGARVHLGLCWWGAEREAAVKRVEPFFPRPARRETVAQPVRVTSQF